MSTPGAVEWPALDAFGSQLTRFVYELIGEFIHYCWRIEIGDPTNLFEGTPFQRSTHVATVYLDGVVDPWVFLFRWAPIGDTNVYTWRIPLI